MTDPEEAVPYYVVIEWEPEHRKWIEHLQTYWTMQAGLEYAETALRKTVWRVERRTDIRAGVTVGA